MNFGVAGLSLQLHQISDNTELMLAGRYIRGEFANLNNGDSVAMRDCDTTFRGVGFVAIISYH